MRDDFEQTGEREARRLDAAVRARGARAAGALWGTRRTPERDLLEAMSFNAAAVQLNRALFDYAAGRPEVR